MTQWIKKTKPALAVILAGVILAGIPAPVQAHTLYNGPARSALMGNPGDDDLVIKRNRLESAFDVNIVAIYPVQADRTGTHTIWNRYAFERANGERIYRWFESWIEAGSNTIHDVPEIPY